MARRLRTGQVEINGGTFNPLAPFGGYKQSGHGRELGKFGLEEFLTVKAMQLPGEQPAAQVAATHQTQAGDGQNGEMSTQPRPELGGVTPS